MSTPDRSGQQTADSSAAADAWADREARLGADAASMLAGRAPGHDEQLVHHDGLPSVQEQMHTHVPPPTVPDAGGHDSPSAHIG